jgi:hypothetical protein
VLGRRPMFGVANVNASVSRRQYVHNTRSALEDGVRLMLTMSVPQGSMNVGKGTYNYSTRSLV